MNNSQMISLDDKIWKQLNGGYKVAYDVSVPLKRLELTSDRNEIDVIYNELWDELHHQGDVDLASYLAVPQLVRIARRGNLFDWNLLGLCATIEQQRLLGNNPALPPEYVEYYQYGLSELKSFVVSNLALMKDEVTFRSALSALAACDGYVKLSKAIIEMSDDVLDEFIEKY